jgi:predicted MFS family arabinose efflux permease
LSGNVQNAHSHISASKVLSGKGSRSASPRWKRTFPDTSVFSGAFTRLARPGLVMLGGSAVWGAALALFGLSPDPWVGLAFLVLAGAADTVSVVSRGTIVQLHTPDALRGRVAAAEQIVGQAGPDVGNMRGGLVAGATSGMAALVSGGLLCVTAVVLVGATTPGLRRYSTTASAEDR